MNSYHPKKEKEKELVQNHQSQDFVASQIYQGIWEADGDASCTFDLDLRAAKKRRKRVEGFE